MWVLTKERHVDVEELTVAVEVEARRVTRSVVTAVMGLIMSGTVTLIKARCTVPRAA